MRARPAFNDIDGFEQFLSRELDSWTPAHRTAFAAAIAERWLHVYEAFARREQWGDAELMHQAVDAAWSHASGRTMSTADHARLVRLIHDVTPHMDDFDDAEEALAAAVMVRQAVESCRGSDNLGDAVQASLSAFEAIVPDWSIDPDAQGRLWARGPVRSEVGRQLALLERLGGIATFDAHTVDDIRRELRSPGVAGQVPKRKPAAPSLRTNQEVFEQYRAQIELELRTRRDADYPTVTGAFMAMMWFMEWVNRYNRRRALTSGEYGKLGDTVGQAALVRLQHARDREVTALPDWDSETRDMVTMALSNPQVRLDVRSLDGLHGYGPSVRRLWAEARGQGNDPHGAWQHVIAWARHRPASWAAEDQRKKKGLSAVPPLLTAHLGRTVRWTETNDPAHPWSADVDGAQWRVRLNDFPDAIMYSLLIGDNVIGDFHDWPHTWTRPA